MSRARKLDPEWTVPCPTCGVAAGEPCRSKHAIRLHQSRREALRQLERRADRLLREGSPARVALET